MAEQITGLVVSHTHWDREWYLPFQRFRFKLVELIDRLLDILDDEPSYQYFTLDGQTVVLDDYLEIRPENRQRLAAHIRAGRILVGPWYVLPDEFLVSGESLVRNLLLGHLVAEEFGGVMRVGYLPDTFGHPAQIPQIFRGFGLDNAIIYRGVQTDSSEFIWEAPDGSDVLAVFLPGGYCNAMQMTSAPSHFLEYVQETVDKIKAISTTDTILLMNGCDHLVPRRELAEIIANANERLNNGISLRQGTLPQYIDRVKAANPRLKKLSGEFRKPWPGRVTPGVISTRMYLKLENFRSFTQLEKYAEPLASLAWLVGEPYPHAFLWQAWKYLLQNHPHDSICGCSVDDVHRDMMSRFRWTREIAQEITRRGLDALAARVSIAAPPGGTARDGAELDATDREAATFLAFNSLGQSRQDYCQHYVDFLRPGQDFHVENRRGEVVPHQVTSRRPILLIYDTALERIELEGRQKAAQVAAPPSEIREIVRAGVGRQWLGEEVELLAAPGSLPSAGFTTFAIVPNAGDDMARVCGVGAVESQTDLSAAGRTLENDLLRLIVADDGSLTIFDKRTATTYAGLNLFEDRGDRGDEYTYCPPAEDEIKVLSISGPADGMDRSNQAEAGRPGPRIELVEQGPLRASIEIETVVALPKRIEMDRQRRCPQNVGCPMCVRVSLMAGSPRVEVRVELTNLAEDNVLRVLFPTPIQTEWSNAGGQFEVVRRPVTLSMEELAHVPGPGEEVAVNTYPHHSFVDVDDGARGLAILSRGLTEYQVEPGRSSDGVTIALTLLRSVGWLSRPDLDTRQGNAGPGLATPEAQCLGPHVFEYAILPHAGAWFTASVPQEAERYIVPPVCTVIQPEHEPRIARSLPREFSFISVEPADLVVSALKKAEADDALILRLYNTSASPVSAQIRFGQVPGAEVREVRLVNLAEREGKDEPLAIHESSLNLQIGGHQICSIKLLR